MEQNNCALTGHKYGLWKKENESEVSRTCDYCGFQRKLPIDNEYENEIKKQNIARLSLIKFLSLDIDDINLINNIYVIMYGVINYIENDKKSLIITKLNEILQKSPLTEENKILLTNFIDSIINNDMDLFDKTMDYFKTYNMDILKNPQLQTQQNFSK